MNKNHHTNQTLLQFVLRAQQLARHDVRSDRGYAMLMTSMISLAMLSMLAAYMTMTNLSKSSTNAYVDGTNTFYAAESGLNKRANEFRQKFTNYTTPSGTVPGSTAGTTTSGVTAANVRNCFELSVTSTVSATNDYECRNYAFQYNNNIAADRSANGDIVLSEQDNSRNASKYVAHTFVAPKQDYANTPPTVTTIPPGEAYAGLNALEYRYSVYATATRRNETNAVAPNFTPEQIAAKNRVTKQSGDDALIALYDAEQVRVDRLNNRTAAINSGSNTVLQMDFKNRIVPLFQFAVFYDGDLEINSSSNMTLGGRVHTNANLYAQPSTANANISIDFLARVTAVGSIYNQVDASPANTSGTVRALMTGTSCQTAANCLAFPVYASTGSATDPALTASQLNAFGGRIVDGAAGTQRLNTPKPGFLRKRNYYQSWTGNTTTTANNSGEYYAKADMRLEMVPDRDVNDNGFTTAPWSRNQAKIPFNFTAISSVATETCTTTLPAKDSSTTGLPTLASDPAEDYIDPNRNNATNLKCHKFTKGQLQSLRQPVMVLTDLNQADTTLRTATGATPAAGSEAKILGRPALPTALPALSAGANTLATKTAILRALQVAIASTPQPVLFDELRQPVEDSTSDLKGTFKRLINSTNIPALTSNDRDVLEKATPESIAALLNAWFLPAPIQRIENSQTAAQIAENSRNSGFYDGRERKWITMLQTNIASLSVWNRDGLYVEAIDNDRTTVYATNDTLKNNAFSSGTGTSATTTSNLAFNRSTPTLAADRKGLQTLGLGSTDTSEGGLVLHATVSDDLNGDGLMSVANDVSLDFANPIYKVDAVGNRVGEDNLPLAAGATGVIVDYPRKYRNGATYQSPFGFAFNGGDYLPGPMTLVTDQAVYTQGDFNNQAQVQPTSQATLTNLPATNRLPASVVADTITILSNQCVNTNPTSASVNTNPTTPPTNRINVRNDLGVPVGQLNCGIPRNATGSAVDFGKLYYAVTAPTAVNAAFLSYTRRSVGNLGAGRGFTATGGSGQFSGALNNYIRMLEDWKQTQYFNYSGSMVSLGTPLEYSGQYIGGGTYYMIPVRNFNFDPKFNSFNLLPPLPPQAIFLQQEVFKQNYK